ncbi:MULTISPECIES: hypothetical protein [Pseudomonas syringae group]|uniref:Chemotaxis protein n=1 Tax=Pseudomonas syringae CC1417 TaxID=1357272 RepID=A0AAU8LDV7_PSESX|nr:hypothetical protein [Pseudomonas asturiensis]
MITLNLQFASATPTSTLNTGVKSAADDALDVASDSTAQSPAEGVKVSLSSVSLQKAAEDNSAHSNKDIEESGLPEQAQSILKMIRELQQKIREKLEELQALMADTSLSPDVRRARVAGVQSELGALTNSLMTANNNLAKLSRNGTLSSEQAQQAAALAMKS